jgi:polyisoprenoid-binding protein YceI
VKYLTPILTVAAVALVGMTVPVRTTTTPAPAAQISMPDQNTWKIDAGHSSPTFAVKHLVVSTVRGRMGSISGTISYDGKNVSSIRVDAAIDVKGLSTGNDARDRDLRGADFFDVDKFPTMTFKSKRVEPIDEQKFKLIGDLTIRGTTREVVWTVEGPSPIVKSARDQRVAATATTTINRFDFGLKYNALVETGGAVVGSDVSVTIDIEATRPPG